MKFKFATAGILLLALGLSHRTTYAQVGQPQDAMALAVDVLTHLPESEMAIFTKRVLPGTLVRSKEAWLPLIPNEALPQKLEKGKVAIEVSLYPDGKIREMRLAASSGKVALDRAAWEALTGAQPFAALAPELSSEPIRLRFSFLYNLKPDDE
jgi:TonB family protein